MLQNPQDISRETDLIERITKLIKYHETAIHALESIIRDGPIFLEWMRNAAETFRTLEHLVPRTLDEWNNAKEKYKSFVKFGKQLETLSGQSAQSNNKYGRIICNVQKEWNSLKELRRSYLAPDRKVSFS